MNAKCPNVALIILFILLSYSVALAGEPTEHLISYQGQALDSLGEPLTAGDVVVRIYSDATGGTPVYNSGTDFHGAVEDGIFNILLGSVTPLELDNELMYYLEVDINGETVVGESAGGRQAFYPGAGSHDLSSFESRIQAVEDALYYTCAEGFYDLNTYPGDQCEFELDEDAIYVSTTDPSAVDNIGCGRGPVGTCDGCYPCQSISQGIDEALASGRSKVYVANGTYVETVDLQDGISVIGGFHTATWERISGSTGTILMGTETIGGHKATVIANSLSIGATVEGFIIHGQPATDFGSNSYAVYVRNSSGIVLEDNWIVGSNGGPGMPGSSGTDGTTGMDGGHGSDAFETGGTPCTGGIAGGTGGTRYVGPDNISGGDGGGVLCPPIYNSEASAQDGSNGNFAPTGGIGGTGGDAGDDLGRYDGSCYVPSASQHGQPGTDGSNGTSGVFGSGGTSSYGAVVSDHWTGQAGAGGGDGTHGGGGGGGGAGGGVECLDDTCSYDWLGGTGGGGGSGGSAGEGGTGGSAGGGSFAMLVVGGSPPTISNNSFSLGIGGVGGSGGGGGQGANGGFGGVGGLCTSGCWCAGSAGDGGNGGRGGHGGGGGGGCGGPAFGIFLSGVSGAPDYTLSNTFTGGSGGQGGQGGPSVANPGTDGTSGAVDNVYSE